MREFNQDGTIDVAIPDVSIIMACWNAEPAHLFEAVDSVENAQIRAVELIVVDDGSTSEQTLAALREVSARGHRVITTANNGPAAARNAGVREARGRYILPLDSDDRLGASFAAAALAVLDSRPEVEIVTGSVELFGQREGLVAMPSEFRLKDELMSNCAHVTSMCRRSTWERLGGMDESLMLGHEDYEYWIRVLVGGGVGVGLDEIALHCRIRPESRTSALAGQVAMDVTMEAAIVNNSNDALALLRAASLAIRELNPQAVKWRESANLVGRYRDIDEFLRKIPGAQRLLAELNHAIRRLRSPRSGRKRSAAAKR